jgi:hypothetical protein
MSDPDGEIRRGIENFLVTKPVDGSPVGRMRCLDAASHAVYEEMYSILTGEVGVTDPVEYGQRLSDLSEQLNDLQKKTERAFGQAMAARLMEGESGE